jgi:drug/metabolite transporter (DMT)-like permease
MQALREVSAFTATLAINLEPVYGILLAYVLLGEGAQLHAGYYAGAALIVGAVFAQGWAGRR